MLYYLVREILRFFFYTDSSAPAVYKYFKYLQRIRLSPIDTFFVVVPFFFCLFLSRQNRRFIYLVTNIHKDFIYKDVTIRCRMNIEHSACAFKINIPTECDEICQKLCNSKF